VVTERTKPAPVAPSTKGRRFPAEPLTGREVEALIRACSRRGSAGIRDAALIALLAGTGLRISEALALRLVDLDLEQASLRVLHGKGDRSRLVGLDSGAQALLERWLTRRVRLGIGRTCPIFCAISGSQRGRRLSPGAVRKKLHELGRRAGIEKRVHPHGLRHTFAVELARERVSLVLVSAALGHSNVATTDTYIRHLGNEDVVELMRDRGPIWAPTEPEAV
jgi:integrase/recombinase XerD